MTGIQIRKHVVHRCQMRFSFTVNELVLRVKMFHSDTARAPVLPLEVAAAGEANAVSN